MAVHQGIGTTAFIAPAVSEANRAPSSYVSFTYTEINNVDNFSDHGPEGAVANFTPLKDGITRQLKGAINPGNITINCGDDPLDPGQKAMIAAAATKRLYPIKIIASDAADSNDTDTVVYLGVRVLSAKVNRGQPGVAMRAFVCAIDTPEYEVPSVVVSGGS